MGQGAKMAKYPLSPACCQEHKPGKDGVCRICGTRVMCKRCDGVFNEDVQEYADGLCKNCHIELMAAQGDVDVGWEPWLRGDSVMKIGDRCQRRVREFMEAVGLHTSRTVNLAMNYSLLRELVREEAAEFNEAMMALESAVQDGGSMEAIKEAQVEVIDAICDTIVVLHNTTNAMGIDIAPFFDEVHRSNMAKVGGPVREDGKRLKPEGWKPPALRPILDEQYRRK